MTKSLKLAEALAAWPLDSEQREFLSAATGPLKGTDADTLAEMLRATERTLAEWARAISGEAGTAKQANVRHTGTIGFRPLSDRILVREVEINARARSGIIIPDTGRGELVAGEVLAVGPGLKGSLGHRTAMNTEVGDRVLFFGSAAISVKLSGDWYLILREAEILGVIEPDHYVSKMIA